MIISDEPCLCPVPLFSMPPITYPPPPPQKKRKSAQLCHPMWVDRELAEWLEAQQEKECHKEINRPTVPSSFPARRLFWGGVWSSPRLHNRLLETTFMKTIKRDGSPCAPDNMKNSFLLLGCRVCCVWDDEFSKERELRATNGRPNMTTDGSSAGWFTAATTNTSVGSFWIQPLFQGHSFPLLKCWKSQIEPSWCV